MIIQEDTLICKKLSLDLCLWIFPKISYYIYIFCWWQVVSDNNNQIYLTTNEWTKFEHQSRPKFFTVQFVNFISIKTISRLDKCRHKRYFYYQTLSLEFCWSFRTGASSGLSWLHFHLSAKSTSCVNAIFLRYNLINFFVADFAAKIWLNCSLIQRLWA